MDARVTSIAPPARRRGCGAVRDPSTFALRVSMKRARAAFLVARHARSVIFRHSFRNLNQEPIQWL